jgi:hypothetical protein
VPRLETTEAQREIARQLTLDDLSEVKEIAVVEIRAEFVRLNELAMQRHRFVMVPARSQANVSHGLNPLFEVTRNDFGPPCAHTHRAPAGHVRDPPRAPAVMGSKLAPQKSAKSPQRLFAFR